MPTSENPSFENIKYGLLVEVLNESGYHSGVKIHFFNQKGVLVGNFYKFLPYDKIRYRRDNPVWESVYYEKSFESLRQFFYELKCRVITVLIRSTQKASN